MKESKDNPCFLCSIYSVALEKQTEPDGVHRYSFGFGLLMA